MQWSCNSRGGSAFMCLFLAWLDLLVLRPGSSPTDPETLKNSKRLRSDFRDSGESDSKVAQKWLKSDFFDHFRPFWVTLESLGRSPESHFWVTFSSCPSFPWSLRKYQGKPQKQQGFSSPREPLKILENKQKPLKKTKENPSKKNTKETKTPRKRRTGRRTKKTATIVWIRCVFWGEYDSESVQIVKYYGGSKTLRFPSRSCF